MLNVKEDGSSRRFYAHVGVTQTTDGQWAVTLDDNMIMTNGGNVLQLPTKELALTIALEFDSQATYVRLFTMPMTLLAFKAIDIVPVRRDEMIQNMKNILRFDTACYRCDEEDYPGLIRLQQKSFDPLLKWISKEFKAPLTFTSEIEAIKQDPQSLQILDAMIEAQSQWNLAIFETIANIGKSVVVALAFTHRKINTQETWQAVRVEENFQISISGRVEGIYGHGIEEEHVRMQVNTCRTCMNLLEKRI
jgi:chaperone required for assembly of F1-ATPase